MHHSDRGTQYTSFAFGHCLREAGIAPSMGSTGDAYDNALAESFFASLECELLDRMHFRTREEARIAVFDYLEAWYNPRRRHSALAHASPMEFERRMEEVPGQLMSDAPRKRGNFSQGYSESLRDLLVRPSRSDELKNETLADGQ